MTLERLQKILARAGLGSRRGCEQFILQGRVEVDGKVVTELGSKADPEQQEIRLDGEPVRDQRSAYYLLYKPRGHICSLRPERGKPRAVDLVRDPRRLYTVGRLDQDSEGLIVVTNDGALTQRLTHPSFGVPKEYTVRLEGGVDPAALRRLRSGVHLAEGRTAPAEVRVVRRGRGTELAVVISEGLNRQVRRMFAAVGLKVRRLIRVRIGSLTVGSLQPGGYRRLSRREIDVLLSEAVGGAAGSRPGGRGLPRRSRPADSRKPAPKLTSREKRERRRKRLGAESRSRSGRQRRRQGGRGSAPGDKGRGSGG
jgi:23S rRNA pseudouridine2605 synthase